MSKSDFEVKLEEALNSSGLLNDDRDSFRVFQELLYFGYNDEELKIFTELKGDLEIIYSEGLLDFLSS